MKAFGGIRKQTDRRNAEWSWLKQHRYIHSSPHDTVLSSVDRFNLFYKRETQFLLAFIYTIVLSNQSDSHTLIRWEGWGSLLDSVTGKVNFHYNLTAFHAKFCSRKHSISSWLNAQLKFVMRKLARVVLCSLGIVKGERNKAKYDRVDEEVVEGVWGCRGESSRLVW